VGPDHRRAVALNARVVPDVPSFSVDDGFAYAVPEGLPVAVGSVVRIPLGGRRVRGWVVATGEPSSRGLREIVSVSGDVPVFGRALLGVLRWAAARYVAPLSAVLAKATPPNVARHSRSSTGAAGERVPHRVTVMTGLPSPDQLAAMVGEHAGAGRTAVVSTAAEAEAAHRRLDAAHPGRVVAGGSHLGGAAVTQAWVRTATVPGTIVVGTREVAAWPMAAPGLAVVLGEGRRGMKDKATPTVHARDLLLKRATAERFSVVLAGLVPTAEALARATEVTGTGRRWGLVEVVDRRNDPPGAGLFADRTAAAVRAAHAEGRRVLVFTDRRVTTMRCVSCRTIRRCPSCGAAPGGGSTCQRCGAEIGGCPQCGGRRFEALGAGMARVIADLRRIVGAEAVGEAGSGRPIVVGTERDLPGLAVDLTVIVDADGPIMAPTYRAGEDALRLFARAVAAADGVRGRRAVVQTSDPSHPVIGALLTGDPVPFVRADAARRAALGFPPGGEILVVEATGLDAAGAGALVAEIGERAVVHGPAPAGDALRWLLQARDLSSARVVLRGLVGRWRESGVRVRVDADPIDL
jgi:primosomal protein N' (replication factor Y)